MLSFVNVKRVKPLSSSLKSIFRREPFMRENQGLCGNLGLTGFKGGNLPVEGNDACEFPARDRFARAWINVM